MRIVDDLVEAGVRLLYAVQGGTIAPFIDAVEQDGRITVHYMPHEEAATYCADGANRVAGRLVAAVAVTTGPGLTGTLRAAWGSHCDGVPMLILAGQPRAGDLFQVSPPTPPWLASMIVECRIDQWADARLGTLPTIVYDDRPSSAFVQWCSRVTGVEIPEAVRKAVEKGIKGWQEGEHVFADAGLTLAWTYRVLAPRLRGYYHAGWSQAAMGAAIWQATGATHESRGMAWALVGDGSLGFAGETAASAAHEHGAMVVCYDSTGYSAIRLYQDQFLNGRHYGVEDWCDWGEDYDDVRRVHAPW
jgi:thiamine pyrophosphate-dependent acetolactate synthase large subunit-like protein